MKKSLILLALLVVLLLLLPVFMNQERQDLDDEARVEANGEFVKLTDGVTHYRIAGLASAPTLVFVHGFNGPMTTWDHNIESLADAGYRVVAYDLFGRGYSDRPVGTYDLDLFVRQLRELLLALNIDQKTTLVGSSFGCIVATEFALRDPGRVSGLVLVGPAGFPSPADRTAWLLDIPLLSRYLYTVIGDRMMLSLTRKYYVEPDRYPEAHAAFRRPISFKGYKRAALSTLQNAPLRDYSGGWIKAGELGKPTLLIWGRQDVSFPYANHARALEYMPQAQLVTVEDAAHLPQYEQPAQVNEAILRFANRLPR